MTKLSKAQNNEIIAMSIHQFKSDGRGRYYGRGIARSNKRTVRALETTGLITATGVGIGILYILTDTGHKAVGEALHDGAEKEMEREFFHRNREAKRVASTLKIKQTIMQAHGLYDWEVEVTASYHLRDMSLRYSINLAQKCVGRPLSDLVSIGWTFDKYTVDSTAISLTAHNAKRMGELILIAAQIIESGILDNFYQE